MNTGLYGSGTIAAVATAPGEGGVAVIRISGPAAKDALRACFRAANGKALAPRRLTFGHVLDEEGNVLDEAMGVYLPAPSTYTREDVAEIQCHGGRGAPSRVLARVLRTDGVRPAQPGEFTYRAFRSGRVDLSEAEAVMDVVRAGSETAALAAARQLEGGVSRFVRQARAKCAELLALISAATDFPDEIDEAVTAQRVLTASEALRNEICRRSDAHAAKVVREGVSVVLAGKPNVGKSSLLNALAGYERAIVSEIPGTTRDVLTERITYGGIVLEISDTAGQRDASEALEALGVARARRAEDGADCVLLVVDGSKPLDKDDEAVLARADSRCLLVVNKSDLAQTLSAGRLSIAYGVRAMEVSAETGAGVDELLECVLDIARAPSLSESAMTSARHIDCAGRAVSALSRLADTLRAGGPLDLVADDLWRAMDALSEITGENATEDVIAAVFRNFCVGK